MLKSKLIYKVINVSFLPVLLYLNFFQTSTLEKNPTKPLCFFRENVEFHANYPISFLQQVAAKPWQHPLQQEHRRDRNPGTPYRGIYWSSLLKHAKNLHYVMPISWLQNGFKTLALDYSIKILVEVFKLFRNRYSSFL